MLIIDKKYVKLNVRSGIINYKNIDNHLVYP